VLKARCVAGVDTLILRDAERGSFAVPRDWTDLAAPNTRGRVDGSTTRLDLYSLCELVTLIELLVGRSRGGLVK
jgi:ABC-type Fe3+ transport system substrate-binding protein